MNILSKLLRNPGKETLGSQNSKKFPKGNRSVFILDPLLVNLIFYLKWPTLYRALSATSCLPRFPYGLRIRPRYLVRHLNQHNHRKIKRFCRLYFFFAFFCFSCLEKITRSPAFKRQFINISPRNMIAEIAAEFSSLGRSLG